VPPFSATFTTATFRVSSITRACIDFPFNAECANTGFPPQVNRTSVDRAADQPLGTLKNGDLTLIFTNAASAGTVNATNLAITEQGTAATPVPYTLTNVGATASAPAGATWKIAFDPAYAIKCNTQYNVVAKAGITDVNGVHANAEGCNPQTAPNGDCSDLHFFKTVAYAPQAIQSGRNLINRYFSGTKGTFTCSATQPCLTMQFNAPFDPASVNITGCTGAAGGQCPVTLTQSGTATTVPLKCETFGSPDAGTGGLDTINCQPTTGLAANTAYTAAEQLTGVKSAGTIPVLGTDNATPMGTTTTPVDQTSCTYSGSATRAITTPCPP
jgi:hypothetical protein